MIQIFLYILKTPGELLFSRGNKISTMSMSHHPTSFFILDNEELGTCWIGQAKMTLDASGRSLLPHISRDQLVDKLATKYEEYSYPCLEVERVKTDGTYLFYGLEQWITKLNCEIKRNPRKLRDVNELLTAGWNEGDPIINSTVHVLHINNTKEVIQKVYKKLIGEWEAKGMRCLNKLKCKTYEDKKQDPTFLYNKARKEVLRQIKKTGKMPKDTTIEKYHIKEDEIKEVMEEVVLCQPCEKEFYKRGNRWYCLCDKRTDRCSNPECKEEGVRLGIKVGGSFCEHNRLRYVCIQCDGNGLCKHNRPRSRCKPCKGGSICEHNKRRSTCKNCNGGSVCKHNIQSSTCKKCKGGSICLHNKVRGLCNLCNPQGHIAHLRRTRRGIAIRSPNSTHTLDDLCMTSEQWLKYLNKTFEDRYGRPKNDEDEVHIDEVIPCSAWNLPDDNKYCWHYLNSQWLLAEDNLSKGDSFEEEDKLAMIERIQSSTYISSSEMA
jgi:hypothetical protein